MSPEHARRDDEEISFEESIRAALDASWNPAHMREFAEKQLSLPISKVPESEQVQWAANALVNGVWRNGFIEYLHGLRGEEEVAPGFMSRNAQLAHDTFHTMLVNEIGESDAAFALVPLIEFGCGIPDTWMMRMNSALSAQVAAAIWESLHKPAEERYGVRAPAWCYAVYDLFDGFDFCIWIGEMVFFGDELFGKHTERLSDDACFQIEEMIRRCSVLTSSDALELLAIKGAMGGIGAWWGGPRWRQVIEGVSNTPAPNSFRIPLLEQTPWLLSHDEVTWFLSNQPHLDWGAPAWQPS
jgi:hypothetical protein